MSDVTNTSFCVEFTADIGSCKISSRKERYRLLAYASAVHKVKISRELPFIIGLIIRQFRERDALVCEEIANVLGTFTTVCEK